MEELTKTQIVLLTLLVSFVTSIATGIVTVALVDQSSAGVGQTIQTVIQRTIETVVPSDTSDKNTSKVPPTPTPSENDAIVSAVSKNSAALVRIKNTDAPAATAFVGLGLVINKSGILLTDHGLLTTAGQEHYAAIFADGKEATLTPVITNASSTNAALFTFIPPSSLSVATFGNSDSLALGQKVISLSGADRNIVQVGVISSFDKGSTDNLKAYINTDMDSTNKPFGSIIINLAGEIIGMKTANSVSATASYQSINPLKSEIK